MSTISLDAFRAAVGTVADEHERAIALHRLDLSSRRTEAKARARAIVEIAASIAMLPGVTPEARKLFVAIVTEGISMPQWKLLNEIRQNGGAMWIDNRRIRATNELKRRSLIEQGVLQETYYLTDLGRAVMRLRSGSTA